MERSIVCFLLDGKDRSPVFLLCETCSGRKSPVSPVIHEEHECSSFP
jgi:hypothetical protein